MKAIKWDQVSETVHVQSNSFSLCINIIEMEHLFETDQFLPSHAKCSNCPSSKTPTACGINILSSFSAVLSLKLVLD
jgi:hypothetical protein